MTVIPGQFSEFSDNSRRVTEEWWRFFNQLRAEVEAAGGAVDQINEILQRLEALESDDQLGNIFGQGSVKSIGTLANGTVWITLVNDDPDPGNTYCYGKGPDGVKGFFAIADALAAEAGELTKAVGSDGVATFGLADLADAGGGAIRKFDRDGKGRVSGTSAATTDDLAEGATNLYFTDERAQDAVGSILTNTATVNLTYDDGANTISADVNASAIDHNDTGGKQGGTAGEYYHLTAAEHTALLNWGGEVPANFDPAGAAEAALTAANTYTDDSIADLNVSSGTWTPTLTNTTNITSSVSAAGMYTRVGNVVNFSIRITAQAASGSAGTPAVCVLGMSLPIPTDFVGVRELAGTAIIGEAPYVGGQVSADTTNDRATIVWFATSTSNRVITINGAYEIAP